MNAGGHGLGLSICQKIAKGLNGEITVNSLEEIGTKMTYEFHSSIESQFVRNPKSVLQQRQREQTQLDWKEERLDRIEEQDSSCSESEVSAP